MNKFKCPRCKESEYVILNQCQLCRQHLHIKCNKCEKQWNEWVITDKKTCCGDTVLNP